MESDTTYFIVARFYKTGNHLSLNGEPIYDALDVWINPTGTTETAPTMTILRENGTGEFEGLTFSGFSNSLPVGGNLYIGNLIGGTTWVDVVPQNIPEPVTVSLLGSSLVALRLLQARRRKIG